MTAAAPIHPELRAALDVLTAWIDYRIAYLSLPGMAVAVVRDQELLWSRGFGLADVERAIPATPGTRYRVGSVTKLFTTTAVMQLRDEASSISTTRSSCTCRGSPSPARADRRRPT